MNDMAKIDILRNAFIACGIEYEEDLANQLLRAKGATFAFPDGKYNADECRFLVTCSNDRIGLYPTLQKAIFDAGMHFSVGKDVKIEEVTERGHAILSVFRHSSKQEVRNENSRVYVFTDILKRLFGARG